MAKPRTTPLILVTRPEPEASETAAALRALGYRALVSPALRRVRLERAAPADLAAAQAAALTSAAAAAALAEDLGGAAPPARLGAYCVGERTAAAARRVGFARVETGPGDAAALLPQLRRLDPRAGPLLLLRGREIAVDLAEPLTREGFTILETRLYAAEETSVLAPEARAAMAGEEVAAALFLSARTVDAFLAAALAAGLSAGLRPIAAVCNSQRTAEAARRAAAFGAVATAATPTLDATFAALRATIPPQG